MIRLVGILTAVALSAASLAAQAQQTATPEQARANYERLRQMALTTTAESLGLNLPTDRAAPYAVVMETGYPDVQVTVSAIGIGDASIYISNGGGVIGGFSQPSAVRAAVQFVADSEMHLSSMQRAGAAEPPTAGEVRFNVLTSQGLYVGAAPEAALDAGVGPLAPLFASAKVLIAELRRMHQEGSVMKPLEDAR
jgi:hypothetical protein